MSNLSDFSLWQLQICYQSPGLTNSLSRREGCWFWWHRQWITERTCDQRSLSLPVNHSRIRASGIPLKHDSQGGIWKELVRITVSARNGFWLRQDRYKITNVQSRSSAFRPPAPGNIDVLSGRHDGLTADTAHLIGYTRTSTWAWF